MSGELQILLVVVLSVAPGAVALIYYLRKRKGRSPAEQAPNSQDSGTLDHDATALPKQETPPMPESLSSDEAAATPPGLDEEVEQSAVGRREHKDNAVAAEGAPRAELEPRPEERTAEGDLIDAPRADVVTPPAPTRHKEGVAGDGCEPETTPSQVVKSETAPTPDIAGTTKEGAPAVELDAPVSGTPETETHQSGAGLPVRSATPAPGAETREAVGEDAVEQPEINDDHLPAGAGDEQAHLPAESALPLGGSDEAKSSDVSVVPGEDVTATEGLDKDQSAQEREPSKSPGENEAPGLADRETSVPEPTLGGRAGDEDSCTVRGPRATEAPDASPEEEEVVEDPGVWRDEQPPGQMTEDGGFDSEEEYDEPEVEATSARPSQKKRARRKEPRKYKGLARVAPQPRDATPQSARPGGEESAQRERSLPIEVRLRFDRGGFCSVSLIPKRSPGLPEDLTAASPAGEVVLRAMQDEWYQDVFPEDISRVLRDGTVWTQEGSNGQYTWSLSGRTLYVLADRPHISGYVSQPCLDLGRDHVVLCSEPLRSQVEDAIRQTGAQPTTVLDESFGAPPGWVVFRGVVPSVPVAPAGEADLFNALRPLPRIEISLERGIRLGYANWLDGHPPLVRVYGDPHATEVRIDGQVAACGSDGAYRVAGWDSLGSHTVWCSGKSRSYSIVPFDASWDLWEGYAFPVGPGETRRLTVCGPIVQAVAIEPSGAGASIPVSETNPVLLGPEPGQIAMAMRVSAQRGAPYLASPSFHPVWALPRDPLHCDKKTTRIVLVGGKETWESPTSSGLGVNSGRDSDVVQWCRLILDASRKGMATAPETESVRALWLSYKRLARQLWRSRR